jgi:hypothetical protein
MASASATDRVRTLAIVALAGALAAAGPAGCSHRKSGGIAVPSPAASPEPSVPSLVPPPPQPRTASPSATVLFGPAVAVACGGRPGADQVLSALRRRSNLLPAGVRANVQTGPLCAGDWQYTVILVSGREPLQVVTRGAPGALTLVTAGTDVCNVTVRTTAPPGIITAAHCT